MESGDDYLVLKKEGPTAAALSRLFDIVVTIPVTTSEFSVIGVPHSLPNERTDELRTRFVDSFIARIPSAIAAFGISRVVEAEWETRFVGGVVPTDSDIDTLIAFADGAPNHAKFGIGGAVRLSGRNASRMRQARERETLQQLLGGKEVVIYAKCARCSPPSGALMPMKYHLEVQGSHLLCQNPLPSSGKPCSKICS
jgi:hypothetical protein